MMLISNLWCHFLEVTSYEIKKKLFYNSMGPFLK